LEYANNEKTRLRYVCYSTCSIFQEEDEQVVKDILKKYGDKWEIPPNMPEIVEKVF
jgi:16S rRNA C967 or C1407 C5-methylase (RsmB/RsmF family)